MIKYQTLYKKSKNNKITQWSLSVDDSEDIPVILRESGFIGFKFRTNRRLIKKGTNVGKSNEKTPYENACAIADKYWKKHIEDNYVESLDDVELAPKFLKPMLAKTFTKLSADKFPVYVQPKYNGIRGCSFRHEGDKRVISRERKEFPAVSHIRNSLDIFGELSPDGEIYHHDLTFQEIVRRTKKYRPGLTEELEYWVYDLAIPNVPFSKRKDLLKEIIPIDHPTIKAAPCYIAVNNDELQMYHDKFVKQGFEGLIIRIMNSLYSFNDRPSWLMKHKEFIDSEFPIVGFDVEEWDDNGVIRKLVLWVCQTEEGNTFTVRPKGSFMNRALQYERAKDYIGMDLTVRYQEKSEDGTPIFGVGLAVRDYE